LLAAGWAEGGGGNVHTIVKVEVFAGDLEGGLAVFTGLESHRGYGSTLP